jgi:hypothetical protein
MGAERLPRVIALSLNVSAVISVSSTESRDACAPAAAQSNASATRLIVCFLWCNAKCVLAAAAALQLPRGRHVGVRHHQGFTCATINIYRQCVRPPLRHKCVQHAAKRRKLRVLPALALILHCYVVSLSIASFHSTD